MKTKQYFGVGLAIIALAALWLGTQQGRPVAGKRGPRGIIAKSRGKQVSDIQIERLLDGNFQVTVLDDGQAPAVTGAQDGQQIAVGTPVLLRRAKEHAVWSVGAANTEMTLRVKHGSSYLAMSFRPRGVAAASAAKLTAGPVPLTLKRANGQVHSLHLMKLQ